MIPLFSRFRHSTIEVLECRIAPATIVTLTSGSLTVQGDYVDDGSSTVQAGAEELLSFSISGPNLVISDPTHGVTPSGSGFTVIDPRQLSIPLSSITGDITINTGTGTDSLTFNNSLVLAADGSLSAITTGTITLSTGAGITTSSTGAIALETVRNIVLDSGSTLLTADGGLTLSANAAGTTVGNFDAITLTSATLSTSASGPIILIGKAGVTSAIQHGIIAGSGTVISSTSVSEAGSINLTGAGNNAFSSRSIWLNGVGTRVVSVSGDIDATGTLGYFDVRDGARIASTGTGSNAADISVISTGGSGASSQLGINIGHTINLAPDAVNKSQVTSVDGSVILMGTGGGNGSGSTNLGVGIFDGAFVASSGTGSVTVVGVGGNGSSSPGLAISGLDQFGEGAKVTTGSGALTLKGRAGTGTSSLGLEINSGGRLQTSSGGAVTLISDTMNLAGFVDAGTGGVTIRPANAPDFPGEDNGDAISLGTGVDTTPNSLALSDAELDRITAGTVQIGGPANGTITVTAAITHPNHLSLTTGALITFNNAVTMAAGKSFTASALGTINFANTTADLSATGNGAISIVTPRDILLAMGSSITAVDGSLTLSANAAGTTTGNFSGVNLLGGLIQATGSGTVSVTGKGGTTGNNPGVRVQGGGDILGGTSGLVTVTGTGGPSNNGNTGVRLSGSGSSIGSGGASVTVTGQGGSGTGSVSSFGVHLEISARITAGGTGNVTVLGTGGNDPAAGNNLIGLLISNGSIVDSAGGNVSVTGIGGTGTLNEFAGIFLDSGTITAGGAGTVTVAGTGGMVSGASLKTTIGIDVRFQSMITSSGGNVSVTGTGGNGGSNIAGENSGVRVFGDGTITAGGTGSVTVSGTGASGPGIGHEGIIIFGQGFNSNLARIGAANGSTNIFAVAGNDSSHALSVGTNNAGRITAGSNNAIEIIADSIDFGSGAIIFSGTGTTTIIPRLALTVTDLGGADVLSGSPLTLGLTDAELDRITAGTLHIFGSSSQNPITVSAPITHGNNLSLVSGSTLTIGNAASMGVNRSFTADALSVTLTNPASDLSASGSGSISLIATRDISLAAGSSIATVNGSLTLSANTSGTVVGAFNGITLTGATLSTTGTGAINLVGKAGAAGGIQHGIFASGGTVISSTSTAADAGSITLTGVGANVTSSRSIWLHEVGTAVTSVSGDIAATGTRGAVDIRDGARVASTGTGADAANISITSTAGDDSNFQSALGIGHTSNLAPDAVNKSRVTSIDGAVIITGTGGGNGGGTINVGVGIYDGAFVASTGTGSVAVIGVGGNGSSSPGLAISGMDQFGEGARISAGSGGLILMGRAGTGVSSLGLEITGGGRLQTSSAGTVSLFSDTMFLDGVVDAGTGSVLIRQANAADLPGEDDGDAINLGSGVDSTANTLALSDAELDRVTAGILQIGNSGSGALTVSAPITRVGAGALTLIAGGGSDILLNASVTTGGGELTFGSSVVVGGNVAVDTTGGGTVPAGAAIGFGGTVNLGFGGLAHNAGAANSSIDFPISGTFGLTKEGSGTLTLSAENSYTGTTSVIGGALALVNTNTNNIATSPLIELLAGATLDVTGLGMGTGRTLNLAGGQTLTAVAAIITGNLGGSGTIRPGGAGAASMLTINGNFAPAGTVAFDLSSPYTTGGTDYDQIIVNGALDMSGAALAFNGGVTPPVGSPTITLISRNGPGATIAGVSPAEGSAVAVENATFTLFYNGGDGNDVVFAPPPAADTTVAISNGDLFITAGPGNDSLRITRSGTKILISDPNRTLMAGAGATQVDANTVELPLLVGAGIFVNTFAGVDSLTLDLANGSFFPSNGINFNGGLNAGGEDALIISGGSLGDVTWDYAGPRAGEIIMGNVGTVRYSGTESLTQAGEASRMTFTLPGGTNAVTLGDDGILANNRSRLSGVTVATTNFTTPVTFVQFNRGSAADSFTFNGSPDLASPLTAGTPASPFALITVSPGVTLGRAGMTSLDLAADSVLFGAGSIVTAPAGTLAFGAGTIGGSLQGGLGLNKAGGGALVLSGFSTNTGPVSLTGGSVVFNSALPVGLGPVTLTEGVTATVGMGIPAINFRSLEGGGTLNLVNGSGDPVRLILDAGTSNSTLGVTLSGPGALTKVGSGTLQLTSAHTHTGPTTIASGAILLGHAQALRDSTVVVAGPARLEFITGINTFHLGNLAGAGDFDLQSSDGLPVTLRVGANGQPHEFTGVLAGTGSLVKTGAGTLTLKGLNDFGGGTFIEDGVLNINSNAALGSLNTPVIFLGGTLHATGTFTIPRAIELQSGTATFEADAGKTLTLPGIISGAGSLSIGTGGKVNVTNNANTNTGPIELDSNNAQMVNGVQIALPVTASNIIVTPGITPGSIATIDLSQTNTPVTLMITAPAGQTVIIERIISTDNTDIRSIVLGTGVVFGSGVADTIPDLMILGKVGSIRLDDVAPNTIISLGSGLSYLDTYKNKPNITLGNIMGDGVVIDVTGDGTVAGTGGGGLGAVVINSWAGTGLIKTTQSIQSVIIKNGDFRGSILVDPDHLGVATVANIGTVSIPNGLWLGGAMQTEGIVTKFLTNGVTEGSSLSAGAFGTVVIKGDYAGTMTATYNAATVTGVGPKAKIIATGAIGNVTIAGDFLGVINGDGKVSNITLTTNGSFEGSVRGGSVGNITAGSFTGTLGSDSITAIGSIGKITAKLGGLTNYVIAAGTDLGSDAIYGGVPDVFTSFFTNKTVKTAVSVGAVTIKGSVVGTTIAAGINPGPAGIYGDADDVAMPLPSGTKGFTKLGALKFETAGSTLSFSGAAVGTIGNAFEAQTLTTVQFGALKVLPTYLSKFLTAQYINVPGASTVVRVL